MDTQETIIADLRRVIAMLEGDVLAQRRRAERAERERDDLHLEVVLLDSYRVDRVVPLPEWAATLGISASAAASLARKGRIDVIRVGQALLVLPTARNEAYVPGGRGPKSKENRK